MGGKGKGKSKGKKAGEEPDTATVVWQVVPAAAKHRAHARLTPSQWNVPVVAPHMLSGRAPGVALVYEDQLADAVERVGYTSHPVAIVSTKHANL
eukprot:6386814-Amphidinium_carterae.2